MTQTNNLTTQPIHWVSLGKRMILGALIALILITIFLIGAGEPNPAWGKLWMIKPLIIVPLAGSMGGVFNYMMDHLSDQGGWSRILTNILSLIVFIIGLWLGTVLGLNGTYWN